MCTQLKVGAIVKVVGEECSRRGKQGQVVGFDLSNPAEPVRVWFDRTFDYLISYPEKYEARRDTATAVVAPTEATQATNLRTWNYAAGDLEVCPDWSVETIVHRYFEHTCWRYEVPDGPFVATDGEICEVEGCSHRATERIFYNIWGTVCFAHVCPTCAARYGWILMDCFPRKKRLKLHAA